MSRFLLLHRAEAVTVERLTRDVAPVAAILGLDPYVTRLRLLGTGVQPLLIDLDRANLEDRAARLRRLGMRAVVYDPSGERRLKPVRIRGITPSGDGLRLTGLEGADAGRIGPDDRLLVVPIGLRQPHDFLRGRPHPESIGGDTRFDILTADGRWFSIRPAGFNFGTLGPDRSPSTAVNLKSILDLFQDRAGSVLFHVGCPVNFGRPMEAADREFYTLRAGAAWQAGCLEGPEPAADGDPSNLGAMLVDGDTAVLTAVPLRRRAIGWTASLSPRVPTERLWIGGWAVMFVVGALGRMAGGLPLRAMTGGGLAVGAVLCAVFGTRQLRKYHRVADTPRARVRSVAMGPAELSGVVDVESPVPAPYSRTLCAWYQFRLERWDATAGPAGRGTGAFLTSALIAAANRDGHYAERGGGWRLVHEGDSADLSFWLKDDTGRIRVEPAGAELHIGSVQTFHVESHGTRYRVTERVLPIGAPVYALGNVQRAEVGPDREREVVEALRRLKADPQAMSRYDVDGNGRIDDAEWEAARTAVRAQVEARLAARTREDTVFIGRGGPGEPFLLSDRDEVWLTRRLRWFARFGLGAAIPAAMWAAHVLFGGG